jgi:D-alanyl-D-alanine carboxypeptidase
MFTSLLNFYITAALQPILPISINQDIPIINENALSIEKLDFSSILPDSSIPIKKEAFISPVIEAKSSIAMDNKTGVILYEKNSHERRQIASITKLMTATVILEDLKEGEISNIVTVSKLANIEDGSQMFLRAGEQITIENLLYGLLINSANDAAITLAEYNAGSVEKFVEKMNKKAISLGLLDTHFQNPVGLDNTQNYSSAYDVAKLARYAYKNEFIKKATPIKEMKVQSVGQKYTHELKTTNELLDSYLKIKGLKTGTTEKAGLCMAAVAENDNGNDIITVVLGSPARFTESKILIDWVFRAYIW